MSAHTVSSLDDVEQLLLDAAASRICIERSASDNVTIAFMAKANQLQKKGMRPVVVCVDDVARQRYVGKRALFPDLAPEMFLTMRDLCLRILSQQAVKDVVGRDARVLDENEHDVLMEDMKASGLKPRRLREMLKFFYRSLSDGTSEEDRWLVTPEEQMIFAMLEENLEVRRAFLPCELSLEAYRGLVETGLDEHDAASSLVVLCDDFGALSKTSQRLLERLARGGLVVAASPAAAAGSDEAYPHPAGFAAAAQMPETLVLNCSLSDGEKLTQTMVCLDPAAEFTAVADAVAERLAQGVPACEVLVAVPNDIWGTHLADELSARGIKAKRVTASAKIKGDPRSKERCGKLKLAAFLKLFLNPTDLVALRSWLGIGDWLLRSDAFLELMAYAREHNVTVAEALASLHSCEETTRSTTLFKKLDGPLDELAALNQACKTYDRSELITLFEQYGMPLQPSQVALLGDDPQKPSLENLARFAFAAEVEAETAVDEVVIAPFKQCHGRFARVVFMTGLVNGFLPALDAVDDAYTIDHRKRAQAREEILFEDVRSMATEEVVFSYFERDLFENVGAMKMQMGRVFMKDSLRFAQVVPCLFVSKNAAERICHE